MGTVIEKDHQAISQKLTLPRLHPFSIPLWCKITKRVRHSFPNRVFNCQSCQQLEKIVIGIHHIMQKIRENIANVKQNKPYHFDQYLQQEIGCLIHNVFNILLWIQKGINSAQSIAEMFTLCVNTLYNKPVCSFLFSCDMNESTDVCFNILKCWSEKCNLTAFAFYLIKFYEATLHYIMLLYNCFYILTLVFTLVKTVLFKKLFFQKRCFYNAYIFFQSPFQSHVDATNYTQGWAFSLIFTSMSTGKVFKSIQFTKFIIIIVNLWKVA